MGPSSLLKMSGAFGVVLSRLLKKSKEEDRRKIEQDMRGRKTAQTNFLCTLNVEDRIPARHPIREVKRLVGEVFARLDGHFEELYAEVGRGSIPPERVLGAKVLMALYTVRSERQFCERLQYDLLFQWFLDINPDEPQACFDATVFAKNAPRLLAHDTATEFFQMIVTLAQEHGWVSNEHFSVDGSLIQAWAGMKSFRPKDEPRDPGAGHGWTDFKGEKRSNDTHESLTDPSAKLARKGPGQEARLTFGLHAGMENRNGLCVALSLREVVGESESKVGVELVTALRKRGFVVKTAGGDKGYHTAGFVGGCRAVGVAPHTAEVQGRAVAGLDGRTTRTKGYQISLIVRRRIEEIFGWMKTIGGFRKSRYRGVARTNLCALMVGAAYNLVRMAKLSLSPPPVTVGA